MKAIKRTPVPLPVPKSKSTQKAAPARPQLSQEFVDSDDDSSNGSPPQAQTVTKPQTAVAIHTPNGAVKERKEKPKVKSGVKEIGTPKSASQVEPAPKKPAPAPEPVADSSSSEESDATNAPTENGQTKGVSSDSSADSSSDESEEEPAPQPSRTSAQERGVRKSQTQSHAVEFQPAQPYVPPEGFKPISLNDKTTSKLASIFDNLDGKEVWHMTAPAGVSLKNLNKLPLERVFGGQTILNHKGTDYGFSQIEKSEYTTREVLVPGKTGIKAVPARISQTLHLQAVVRLPELSNEQADPNTGSEAAASITRSTIRTPRAQVTGLKMRFLPSGFGGNAAGTIGDSDDEMQGPTETAGLGMPNGLNLPSRKKEKRKHAEVIESEAVEEPAKRSKKHKSVEDAKRKEQRRAKKEKRRAQDAASAK